MAAPFPLDSPRMSLTEARHSAAPGTLETARLALRPMALSDAPTVALLAGRREIADTTISVPHPCSEAQARAWIAARSEPGNARKELVFAVTLRSNGQLIGAVGLRDIDPDHAQAELGFWIGVEFWGQGYATEAARAAVGYAFDALQLNRVCAHHMVRNPTSGSVLGKVGLKPEGLLRQRVRKWGVYEDVVVCAILREDWIVHRTRDP
jgi:[ribosomal protein S5]-alanine N-acetyltransferase